LYHRLQKAPLFDGLARKYEPLNEDGETFPDEKKLVQLRVKDAVVEVKSLLTDMFDLVATQDFSNCGARADVIVAGEIVLKQVPVTTLLYLEKQLNDIRTFIKHMPLLDPAETWNWDDKTGTYVSEVIRTNKTKKIPRNHVKAEATDKHPAQVELYYEDVKVGEWKTTKFSGAIGADHKETMLARVEKLQEAVKMARERANELEVVDTKIGQTILNYVFGNWTI
jgi:hypothetical protein